ncbi:MAG: DNA repair exonuclease [Chloroflexi bacterium]|nr:DNA repair exonuclease [Chloroflexota bacterium]
MGLRFIHAADIHLGNEQYGVDERYNDFTRALVWLTDQALTQRVAFVLLAGDLFNKLAVAPRTLFVATRSLQRLADAGIRTIAVEGNHERSHQQDRFNWLDYLAHSGLLTLLRPVFTDSGMELLPIDPVDGHGSYIDLPGGVRVIGLPFLGASTSRVVADLVPLLPELPGPRPAFTILMLHSGLEGVLPNYAGGVTRTQLAPLRPHIDYVAMGHIHKPFEQDDWVFNPGSLETNGTLEVPWTDRGCYVVDLDDSRPARHRVTRVVNPRRPFVQLSLEADAYRTTEELYGALERLLAGATPAQDAAQRPVVFLRLHGNLSFSPLALEPARLESLVTRALNPLHYALNNEVSAPGELAPLTEGLGAAELERQVLVQLAENDVQFRGQGERWADMLVRVKHMAVERSAPEEIVSELRAFQRSLDTEAAPC